MADRWAVSRLWRVQLRNIARLRTLCNSNKHVLECECKAQRNVNEPVRSADSNPACTNIALPDGETILGAG
jgi:hypothetical protein